MAWEDRTPAETAVAVAEEIIRDAQDDNVTYCIHGPGFSLTAFGIVNATLIAAKFPGATITPKGK